MSEKPTTYIVSVFEEQHWRAVLTTTDINQALAKAMEIGDQVQIVPAHSRRWMKRRSNPILAQPHPGAPRHSSGMNATPATEKPAP